MSKRAQYPSEQADKFLLRLPDGMRERIAEAAKKSGRSMNAEIAHRLEQSFAPAVSRVELPDLAALQQMTDVLKMMIDNRDVVDQAYRAAGVDLVWDDGEAVDK